MENPTPENKQTDVQARLEKIAADKRKIKLALLGVNGITFAHSVVCHVQQKHLRSQDKMLQGLADRTDQNFIQSEKDRVKISQENLLKTRLAVTGAQLAANVIARKKLRDLHKAEIDLKVEN